MSFTKKFAWSGSAVLVAALFALALMAQTASATITVTPFTTTAVALTTNLANGSGVTATTGTSTVVAGSLTLAATAANDLTVGTLILQAPTGWRWDTNVATNVAPGATGATFGATTYSGDGLQMIINVTGAVTGAGSVIVGAVTAPKIWPLTNTSANGNITVSSSSTSVFVGITAGTTNLGTITAGTALTAPYSITMAVTGSSNIVADGTQTTSVTALVRDVNLAVVSNTAVLFSTGIGCYTTACTATSTVATASTGIATTTYRGKGTAGVDTLISTVASLSAVGTTTVTLSTATGTTAATQSITAVTNKAVAASTTAAAAPYFTPNQASDVTIRVVDGAANGVNAQVMLISVDKGALVGGAGTSCVGVTAKSITQNTATIATVVGRVQVTYCAVSTEKGTATLTSQNISTSSVANATTTLTSAGRPDKIEIAASGTNITATVKDVDGNVVANGTPIRFTIGSTVGAASNACVVTTDGTATSVIALTSATGSVIVSTDWNEATSASTCAAPGSQSKAVLVNLPSGTIGSGTGTPTPGSGTGTITSGSVPASGGFGLIVFGGGTAAQLVTASGCPSATSAFWVTSAGAFVTYIPGTTIAAVNAAFLALFAGGTIPANTAFVGKCV